MLLLKEKTTDKTTPTREKIQILTMAPLDWSRKEVANFFEVSEYSVREARKLAAEKGILALPDSKRGRSLSEEVENSVKLFYEDDEFSRLMPGTKDYVSIARNVHKQKRLLLTNLKELYCAYKEKYPLHKVGLSKFCQLRPKWCVTVSSSGTHSVCVCQIHQNSKLMVEGYCNVLNRTIKRRERAYWKEQAERAERDGQPIETVEQQEQFPLINSTYKDMMSLMVCDTDKLECMVHRCENCPTSSSLRQHITAKFEEYEIEEDIEFSQWESTDRTTLRTYTSTVEDFIDLLVDSIDSLTTHSYIAKSQAQYLKRRKDELDGETCLLLLDFAENYHYIVQDEVQGYHWNKEQCTLHPVVLYYKNSDNILCHKCLCIISDDLTHDTSFVHQLQILVCDYIKENLPQINRLEYWSDGCAGQYKNYKNFMNLCQHTVDFGFQAIWSFFATSHGKSPCDGVGGTVKRKMARTSLQRPVNDQILTFEAVEKFCREELKGIVFMSIYKDDMVEVRAKLEKRYEDGDTVAGTRSCHHFEPISTTSIRAKQLSDDKSYLIDNHSFYVMPAAEEMEKSLQPNDYAACLFDGYWWVVRIEQVNLENKDVTCQFMHPHGPTQNNNFHWPTREDNGWVPFGKFIMKIDPPSCTSNSGRQFQINGNQFVHINNIFRNI